ncbi:MAG TPA: GNAT family N-acetyltransferase [Clostridiales bacterium]|jgi:GNAT superfamily N-acetyltransferase|nr:GNAT family N-acetyltransferase [Clostridiales bacterium]
MIKRIESETIGLEEFCQRDVFGCRIFGYISAYGYGNDAVEIFLQYKDEKITAALCKIDGVISLTCSEECDFTELSSFLSALSFDLLQAKTVYTEKLGFKPKSHGHILEFVSCPEPQDDKNVVKVSPFEADDIYKILKNVDFVNLPKREIWLADTVHRMNKNTARACAYMYEGEKAATAMVLFDTGKAVLIGAVATLPEYRGRGFAALLVKKIACKEKGDGKTVYLLCVAGGIVGFYEKLGFKSIDDWTIVGMDRI